MEQIIRNEGGTAVDEYRGMLQKLIELGIGTSEKVSSLDGKVSHMERRMDNFEYNEEITYRQQQSIRSLADTVVCMRLGINTKRAEWTKEEQLINAKYGKLFHRRLYSDVARNGHLGNPYRTTRKGNYQAACEDIEAWIPRNGIEALKREADENAEARRIAREQGYE